MDIFVVSVTHRHGTDLFAATTREGALGALANYVRDSWEGEHTPGSPQDHADDDSLVDAYFRYQRNHGEETYALESIELIGALSIQAAEQPASVEAAEQPAAVEPPRRPRP